jgi:quercetin dioxygenase-like cupin family protein
VSDSLARGDQQAADAARGRRIWAFGDLMTFLVTGSQSGGRCFVMEQVVPRHVRPPGRHRHTREDHVWYVQAGHGRFYVGDMVTEAGRGSVLWGPRGVPHAFSADSERLHVLVTTMPAGLEAFFNEIGQPAPGDDVPPADWRSPVDDEATRATAYGIELLGSQPGWSPFEG